MRLALSLCFAALLTGCPQGHDKPHARLPPCTRFGDNCEFSPGKLGSCVMRDGCTQAGSECYVCQSQH
ncbi:MAG TPA: hypothetical protein VGL19_01280 [Polyangiaceae bacterium]|jgi:hypothetical protein